MKNKKNLNELITINIRRLNWERLQMIKIKAGYKNMDEVIEILLGEK